MEHSASGQWIDQARIQWTCIFCHVRCGILSLNEVALFLAAQWFRQVWLSSIATFRLLTLLPGDLNELYHTYSLPYIYIYLSAHLCLAFVIIIQCIRGSTHDQDRLSHYHIQGVFLFFRYTQTYIHISTAVDMPDPRRQDFDSSGLSVQLLTPPNSVWTPGANNFGNLYGAALYFLLLCVLFLCIVTLPSISMRYALEAVHVLVPEAEYLHGVPVPRFVCCIRSLLHYMRIFFFFFFL